jgi:segregation and condensation protein A
MEYVELMRELDLEIAGEFILMAATLIQIKVRMLLPRSEEEGEEEEDPRADLVRQLIEYKRFKEVAESISEIEEKQRRLYPRLFFSWTKKYQKEEISGEELLKDISLFDLLSAFKTVLDNMPKVTAHEVTTIGATIDDQIDFLLNEIREKERIGFHDIMTQLHERVMVIVTFMAILELIRTHRIRIQQAGVFSEIWILRR